MEDVIITVKDRDFTTHTLICPVDMGLTLKDMCQAYELPMEAVCGGMCMCATCHCYVTEGMELLEPQGDLEEALLSELFTIRPNSRLACQIPITRKLNGLAIEIAPQ